MLKTDLEVAIELIADLLLKQAVNDEGFFAKLAEELESRGHRLCAQQHGIRGTCIYVEKIV